MSEYIFIARGEMTPEQLEATLKHLGKQGLRTTVYSGTQELSDELARIKEPKIFSDENETIRFSPDLEDIITPEHYLVLEHLEQALKGTKHQHLVGRSAAMAFARVTDPATGNVKLMKKFSPETAGLLIKPRSELGISTGRRIDSSARSLAIQAGSFLELAEREYRLRSVDQRLNGLGPTATEMLNLLADRVRANIEAAGR